MKTKSMMMCSTQMTATFAAAVLLNGLVMAQTPTPSPTIESRKIIITPAAAGGEAQVSAAGGSAGSGSSGGVIRIESIKPSPEEDPAREIAWLGLSTEEANEALASQLGLKPGQGLVVVFVAPDSPAARAGFQKFDVLEEMDDQMLVGPEQLRKLVQMHQGGDTVKLTLHRAGKKQTLAVTLAKRSAGFGRSTTEPAMAFAVMDRQKMNAEVERSMEEARKSIQDALSQSAKARHAWHFAAPAPPAAPQPPELPEAVDVGDDASVTVTKDGASVKSLVKSDDTGVLVIVANPKKRLTAHDQNGKLLFDGEIETPEQQQKVPADLWSKVVPLLEQFKPAEDAAPQPHAQSGGGPEILNQKIETKPAAGVFASL